MIEINDLLLLGGINVLICAIFSLIFVSIGFYFRGRSQDHAINDLYNEMESQRARQANYGSQNKKSEKAERMQALMLEAGSMLKENKPPQEIFTAMISKYPDLAMEFAKKGL